MSTFSRVLPLVALAFGVPASIANSADLLDVAASGLAQSLEQISSLHAKVLVEVREKATVTQRFEGEWWQKDAKIRWNFKNTFNLKSAGQVGNRNNDPEISTKADALLVDGRLTLVEDRSHPDWNGTKQATIADTHLGSLVTFSLWGKGAFLISDSPEIRVLDALRSVKWKKSVREAELGGRRMFRVDAEGGDAKCLSFSVWIDPDHSFFPARLVISLLPGAFDDKKWYAECEVARFQELAQSPRSFPAELRWRFYNAGEPGRDPFLEHRVLFNSLRVNVPIPEERFKLTIPVGYRVKDRVTGQRYTMGTDGKPVQVSALLPTPPSSPLEAAQAPSRSWLWPAVACLAVLVGVAFLYRSRLARQRPGA